MTMTMTPRPMTDRTIDALRRAGNPFRNYFARNPDDEVCARFHVPELYASERSLLLNVVDLYRYDPMTHSEVVPILGNKGAGKTHLLYSIKHGGEGAWQMLVTPGVYQKESDFLEYLLFQIIDTLLGGGQQRGVRPLDYIGEHVVRRLLVNALREMPTDQRLELFPAPGLGRWMRRLGLGHTQAQERCQWLIDLLSGAASLGRTTMPVHQALTEAGLSSEVALEKIIKYVEKTEAHNTAGLMRRAIYQGLAKAFLMRDESTIASFLTCDFAELDFQVRPTRQDLVLALFKVLMEVFRTLKTPVVVAFDQLEDLLLSRRSDDGHKIAEAFFAGIVQVMHQIDGLCFLIFAERGLWNRFVPSLDGYIQDRLNNPVHVPRHGTIKALRLEAPPAELVRRVVEARLAPCRNQLPDRDEHNDIYPFTDEQVQRIAATEPTLRDMLQQFRHLFDHLVYGDGEERSILPETPRGTTVGEYTVLPETTRGTAVGEYTVKSVAIVTSPDTPPVPLARAVDEPSHSEAESDQPQGISSAAMLELWAQEERSARRKLEPEGALTGATRELQAGLGSFLQSCHEHGVKVGPWRLQHVVPEFTFSEHPTYGVITIAHWTCKDGQPWKVGIGLFLGKAAGKPRDLEIKLSVMEQEPAVIDHLILLRPEDDLGLTGKSKQMWQEAEKRGRHTRIEPIDLDHFATLYSFPRWLAAMTEAMPQGSPLPNLADQIQDHCEKLLEQLCMPVQG